MSVAGSDINVEGAVKGGAEGQPTAPTTPGRPSFGWWALQPLTCAFAVAGALAYVTVADVSESERRSLSVSHLLQLLREHLVISLSATVLTCVVAIPVGIALTRGPMRRYSKPIITVASFGQAAPAIGLIAEGAVVFGIGQLGAIVALTVYGAIPSSPTPSPDSTAWIAGSSKPPGEWVCRRSRRCVVSNCRCRYRSSSPAFGQPWC